MIIEINFKKKNIHNYSIIKMNNTCKHCESFQHDNNYLKIRYIQFLTK